VKLTACKKCQTPVIRWDDVGLMRYADITALNTHQLAQAWLDRKTTYCVQTLHRMQWVNQHWPSPFNRQLLIDDLLDGRPIRTTVLVAHTCETQALDIDQALNTWQARDRAAFRPAPKPAPICEGIPF
jgi:hypothetical protein